MIAGAANGLSAGLARREMALRFARRQHTIPHGDQS